MHRFTVPLLALVLLATGCAIQRISSMDSPEQALAAADLLLDEYVDVRLAYVEAAPDLSPERRQAIGEAIDTAQGAVLAVTDMALAYSEYSRNDMNKALDDALQAIARACKLLGVDSGR